MIFEIGRKYICESSGFILSEPKYFEKGEKLEIARERYLEYNNHRFITFKRLLTGEYVEFYCDKDENNLKKHFSLIV